jgi:putative transposase
MSRKGNWWDNAVAESFLGSLKKEQIKKQIYKNRAMASADVDDYIANFYNPTRRHSHLNGASPEQFESASQALATESLLDPGNSKECCADQLASLESCFRQCPG